MVKHVGLIFDEAQIEQARRQREREPYRAAWGQLMALQPAEVFRALQADGLRWRLDGDAAAGERAALRLIESVGLADGLGEVMARLEAAFLLAHTAELVRSHPAYPAESGARLAEWVGALPAVSDPALMFEQRLWRSGVEMALAVVLDDGQRLEAAAGVFRGVVDADIHPEGYLIPVVDGKSVQGERETLRSDLSALRALAVTAEIATVSAGVDLWRYEKRGVSIATAVIYALYYYFYPEKWPWSGDQWRPSAGVPEELARALFTDHAGIFELVSRRIKATKAIQMILGDLRPVYDPLAGGVLTLTHAVPARRGLFGG